jgi:type VI secretion system protein ImpA
VKKKGSSVKTSDNFTQIKNNNSILNLRKTLNSEDFEWLILIKQDIESSEVSIKELEKKLDEKLGNRSISFLGLKKDLYDIKLLVEQLSTRFSERKSSQKEKEINHFFSEQQLEKSTCDNGESFSDRPLSKNLTQVDLRRSVDGTYRSQIYKKINELSRELKNLEPHSPTPYLLERLSTWEDMSLNELVSDIAKMDGTLKGLLTNMEKKND